MQHIIDVLNQISDATVNIGSLAQLLIAFLGGVLAHKKVGSTPSAQ